ncbi:hypothetical protein D3C76_964130 [compost metagenome]
MVQQLTVANATTGTVTGGQTLAVEVPLEFNKILLKSVEVKCSKNIRFSVAFYEDPTEQDPRYDSGPVSHRLLDVLDYAYIDKLGQTDLHMRITNLEDPGVDATFTIEIRGLQLK